MIVQVIIGLALSTALAGVAFARQSLTVSGFLGAALVGTMVYIGGGITWWLILLTFFITSTVLGRVGRSRKAETKREFSKGDRRDVWQVAANGGVAAVSALLYRWSDGHPAWMGAFVGALAACNADTWATELGTLSRRNPRLITTLRPVPPGTSGGISIVGIAATLAGGAVIGLVAGLFAEAFCMSAGGLIPPVAVGVTAGTAGSLFDSMLGAKFQAMYHCPICDMQTEQPIHHCGATARPDTGLAWVNNDGVNMLSSVVGALVAMAMVLILC